VAGTLPADSQVSGIPAYDHRKWLRSSAIIPKIPDLRKSLFSLEKRIAELEKVVKSCENG
jgi:UDP-3-O-[3-hydroxymyristoyl] glucosamine N-acyltransferase